MFFSDTKLNVFYLPYNTLTPSRSWMFKNVAVLISTFILSQKMFLEVIKSFLATV